MESQRRGDSPEDVSSLLAQLAEVHLDLAGIQSQRRRVIAEVQGRRGDARFSIMRVEKDEQRLIARRSRVPGQEVDQAKLDALAADLAAEKATHVQQVEDYQAALQAAVEERARLRKEAQDLEKKRADLARALPRVYARAYGELLKQSVADPIVDVAGGACVCGSPIDVAQELLPTSCESCERLLIVDRAGSAREQGEPRK